MVSLADLVTRHVGRTTNRSVAECIYKRTWLPRPTSAGGKASRPTSDSTVLSNGAPASAPARATLSAEDDAKLIFGTVYSLRGMVRKLGGDDDR